MIRLWLIGLFGFILVSPALAISWPPEVKPEQGKASWRTPVKDTYDGHILGENYTEVLFWNVGSVSNDPNHAKVSWQNDCTNSTVPGCGGGGTTWGTFSGGPNGTLTISGYEYKLHDGKYFEAESGGNAFRFNVENPEIFSKYNWDSSANDKKSKLEDSGAAFSDLFGQVEVNIPNEDGTYDDEKWDFAKLDGKTFPVGTHIKTSNDSGGYISFADMTTFTLKPGSEIILSSPAAKDSQIKLLAGNLWINVKKMFKDGSMEIEMSQAVAGIKGTQFILEETKDKSTIKVTEGSVAFKSKTTGQVQMIGAGETLSADANGLGQKTMFNPDEEEKQWQEFKDNLKPAKGNLFGNNKLIYILSGIAATVLAIGFLLLKVSRYKK